MGKEDSRKRTEQCTNTYGLICGYLWTMGLGKKGKHSNFIYFKIFSFKRIFYSYYKIKLFPFYKKFCHEENTWDWPGDNHKNSNRIIYWAPTLHTGHITDILLFNFTITLENTITPLYCWKKLFFCLDHNVFKKLQTKSAK